MPLDLRTCVSLLSQNSQPKKTLSTSTRIYSCKLSVFFRDAVEGFAFDYPNSFTAIFKLRATSLMEKRQPEKLMHGRALFRWKFHLYYDNDDRDDDKINVYNKAKKKTVYSVIDLLPYRRPHARIPHAISSLFISAVYEIFFASLLFAILTVRAVIAVAVIMVLQPDPA